MKKLQQSVYTQGEGSAPQALSACGRILDKWIRKNKIELLEMKMCVIMTLENSVPLTQLNKKSMNWKKTLKKNSECSMERQQGGNEDENFKMYGLFQDPTYGWLKKPEGNKNEQ